MLLVSLAMEAIGDITASAEVSRLEVDGEEFDSRIQGGVLVSLEAHRNRISLTVMTRATASVDSSLPFSPLRHCRSLPRITVSLPSRGARTGRQDDGAASSSSSWAFSARFRASSWLVSATLHSTVCVI